jgi:hypothetical protein
LAGIAAKHTGTGAAVTDEAGADEEPPRLAVAVRGGDVEQEPIHTAIPASKLPRCAYQAWHLAEDGLRVVHCYDAG